MHIDPSRHAPPRSETYQTSRHLCPRFNQLLSGGAGLSVRISLDSVAFPNPVTATRMMVTVLDPPPTLGRQALMCFATQW